MKNIPSLNKRADAEQIARLAEDGEDVSHFFTGAGRMVVPGQGAPAIQRVNVDFAAPMLTELDEAANSLNISRQAVIKSLLRQALDQQYLARNAALASRQR